MKHLKLFEEYTEQDLNGLIYAILNYGNKEQAQKLIDNVETINERMWQLIEKFDLNFDVNKLNINVFVKYYNDEWENVLLNKNDDELMGIALNCIYYNNLKLLKNIYSIIDNFNPYYKTDFLQNVIVRHNIDIVDFLLNTGKININKLVNKEPYLSHAISSTLEIFKRLLKEPDINVNLTDKDNNTALMKAIGYKEYEKALELLNHPNINVNIATKWDITPLKRHRINKPDDKITKELYDAVEKSLLEKGALLHTPYIIQVKKGSRFLYIADKNPLNNNEIGYTWMKDDAKKFEGKDASDNFIRKNNIKGVSIKFDNAKNH